jgi:transcriptional regulator with XRE-family HTH domain
MVVEDLGNDPHEVFAARKLEAKLSTAELARRSGRSVNTVKKYLSGALTRETTVQALHEALDAYVAEQAAIQADPRTAISSLGKARTDPEFFEKQALQAIEAALEHLSTAATLRIDQDKSSDKTFLKHLAHRFRTLNGYLEPI